MLRTLVLSHFSNSISLQLQWLTRGRKGDDDGGMEGGNVDGKDGRGDGGRGYAINDEGGSDDWRGDVRVKDDRTLFNYWNDYLRCHGLICRG